jgi:hypothetical protein
VVITSTGIDHAGERDTDDNLANVRTDMQRELDTIEDAVRRLAKPCRWSSRWSAS